MGAPVRPKEATQNRKKISVTEFCALEGQPPRKRRRVELPSKDTYRKQQERHAEVLRKLKLSEGANKTSLLLVKTFSVFRLFGKVSEFLRVFLCVFVCLGVSGL